MTQSWIQYDKATGQVLSRVAGSGLDAPADTDQHGWIEGTLPHGHWQVDLHTKTLTPAAPPTEPWWRSRQLNYPSVQDFMDAWYWQQNGDPSKMQDWLKAVADVKKNYPKPGQSG